MKKFILAAGLMGVCTMAFADDAAPSPAQATQALQSAMQKEIQAMSSTEAAQAGIDVPAAINVVKSLEVKAVDNCSSVPSGAGVACDVKTSAEVRGARREDTNKYEFWQQAGRWEARIASNP